MSGGRSVRSTRDRRGCERRHRGEEKETDDDDDDQEHVARRGRQLQRHLERCGGRGLRSMTVVSQRMQASSARERERWVVAVVAVDEQELWDVK